MRNIVCKTFEKTAKNGLNRQLNRYIAKTAPKKLRGGFGFCRCLCGCVVCAEKEKRKLVLLDIGKAAGEVVEVVVGARVAHV